MPVVLLMSKTGSKKDEHQVAYGYASSGLGGLVNCFYFSITYTSCYKKDSLCDAIR
jgi:hypothetical protein